MENEYLAPLPRNQHRSTHGIMKVFQRKLRKSQFHQTILRLLCQISERFVVLFVLHQILQIRIGKCAKEAIAIGSRLSYWLVFRCQIFQFRNIDDIVGVLAIQHRNILQFANKRNCITNLWCGSRLKKEDKNWIVNICHCVYSSTHTDCIRAAAVPITLYIYDFIFLFTYFLFDLTLLLDNQFVSIHFWFGWFCLHCITRPVRFQSIWMWKFSLILSV